MTVVRRVMMTMTVIVMIAMMVVIGYVWHL